MNIVFDLDGTLIDSAPDLQAAVNRMLEGEGEAPLDLPTVTSFIGNGLPKLVERSLDARGISQSRYPELCDRVGDFYSAAPADLTRPYPGVIAALTALTGAGHRLGLCTNKPEEPARLVLDLLGLDGFFGVVVGGDTLSRGKPDPAPLEHAFAALGDGARLYVGDSEIDAETARRAGVRFALFTGGYRRGPVAMLDHDHRFSRHDELAGIVAGLVGAAPAG